MHPWQDVPSIYLFIFFEQWKVKQSLFKLLTPLIVMLMPSSLYDLAFPESHNFLLPSFCIRTYKSIQINVLKLESV